MFTSKQFGECTADVVNERTTNELIELYNELIDANGGGKHIKAFRDKRTALRRVNVEIQRLNAGQNDKPKAAAEAKPRQSGRISYQQKEAIGNHRPSTRRGTIIRLCTEGGGRTIAQLAEACDGWEEADVRVCLKHINSYLGHGVEEDDTGVIRISGTPRGRKPFNLPPAETQKQLRPGTKRKRTFDLLSRPGGATVEEVREATGWNHDQALEGIKLLNIYSGYGLREDDEGRVGVYS